MQKLWQKINSRYCDTCMKFVSFSPGSYRSSRSWLVGTPLTCKVGAASDTCNCMTFVNGVAFKQILHKASFFICWFTGVPTLRFWPLQKNKIAILDSTFFNLTTLHIFGGKIFLLRNYFFIWPTKVFFSLSHIFISSPDKISNLSRKSIHKEFWHNYRIMHFHFIFRCSIALFIHVPNVFSFYTFFVSSNLTMGFTTMIEKLGNKEHTKKVNYNSTRSQNSLICAD